MKWFIEKGGLLVFIFLFITSDALPFQERSQLVLTVTDQHSALVSNIKLRILSSKKLIRAIDIQGADQFLISNLLAQTYTLEIEAKGFKVFQDDVFLKIGVNRKTITLEIEDIQQKVEVSLDKQERSLGFEEGPFNLFLTKAEIDALPEDPVLLKQALQQKFGRDAEFLVDGFSSGGLPPKSEIASIRVSLTSFDAEFHKLGVARIEITTKASKHWRFFSTFSLQDDIFNARNPFAGKRGDSQVKAGSFSISGPLRKEKTAFRARLSFNETSSSEEILAVLPDGIYRNNVKLETSSSSVSGGLIYNINEYQTANLNYYFNSDNSKNLGVGGFDLEERAFDRTSSTHRLRLSQSGNLGQQYFNQFRFEYKNQISDAESQKQSATIRVLDSFNKGGANVDRHEQNQYVMVADNFLFGLGNHAVKIGGSLDYHHQNEASQDNIYGTYTFSSIDGFLAERPSLFTQKRNPSETTVSQVQLAGFINDDIRVSKTMRASLGFRYEWQNGLDDFNNFSPRLGFSWSPFKDGRFVIRGGAGLFYQWLDPRVRLFVDSRSRNQTGEIIIRDPGFVNPNLSEPTIVEPTRVWKFDSNLQNPYTFLTQTGFSIRLQENSSLRVSFGYQKSVHNFRSRLITDSATTEPSQVIFQIESSGFFFRNSLDMSYETNPTKKSNLYIGYRLSKSISDSEGPYSLPSNGINLRADIGTADNDKRHSLYNSIGWTPIQGIQLNGIYQVGSPLPYNLTTGVDTNRDTVFYDRLPGILRNSARGTWFNRFDASARWAISLSGKNGKVATDASGTIASKGKTLFLDLNVENIFNQTNFQHFVGVQTSSLFRQPVSAYEPRKFSFGVSFIF